MSVSTLLVLAAAMALGHGQDYITKSLENNNSYREIHGSPPLALDSTLNEKAMQCAEYYAEIGTIDHACPYKDGAGENLAWFMTSTGSPPQSEAAQQAIDDWYAEVKDYNYDNPVDSTGVTGHFTQLVWMSSEQLGIGSYQDGASDRTYTCALYSPAGNIHVLETDDEYSLYKENVYTSTG